MYKFQKKKCINELYILQSKMMKKKMKKTNLNEDEK